MSLLPNQTNLNPAAALFAPAGSTGGGGGGGGGPNLLVSTIGVNPNGGINMFTDSNIDAPPITFYLDGTNTSAVNLQVVYGANESTSGIGAGEAIGFITNASSNPFAPITCNQVQLCDLLGNLAAVLEAGPTPGSAYISSIYVSSLNGAAPGGGGSVPADLAVSTLQLNDQPTANGARLRMRGADPNLYSVDVIDSNGAPVAGYNLGLSGGRNQFYTGVGEVDQCFVSSINGVGGGAIQVLSGLNVANILTATAANVTMSTLTVSTINGVVPGQVANGGAIGVQSIPDTGPITCVCDAPGGSGLPTPLTTPLGISTVLGHTYTYTAEASIQGGPNQTADSAFQIQLGNNSRFYGDVKPVSTIVGPNTVVSLNWRFIGSTGGNAIYAYNWDPLSNAASTIITLTKQSLTDYGIIL